MNKRVTLRDLANRLGVHYTTVSLALRNHPRIPERTRLKVHAAAREMGYAPDPMVSALSVYRQGLRKPVYHSTLAWMTNSDRPLIGDSYRFQPHVEGARRRAAELGYLIEEFPLHAEGMSAERYGRILRSRGVQGILVAPQLPHRISARIRIDWTGFSAVAFGHTLAWPPLHRVASNQFQSAQLAVRRLRKLGYRRIGMAINRLSDSRGLSGWSGGYLTEMRRQGDRFEPLVLERYDRRLIQEWIDAQRPDAVITCFPGMFEDWPETNELGRVILDCLGEPGHWAGIDQNYRKIGEVAVDQLVGLIHSRQRGIPQLPCQILVNGVWRPGQTVRAAMAA